MDNTTKIVRKLNLTKDKIDKRDYLFKKVRVKKELAELVPVDLRKTPLDPPVRDQGELGSCSAFATTALVNFCIDKQNLPDINPAPLFTYYTTRQIQNTVDVDSGASMRNALKSTVDYGVVSESEWPYNTANYNVAPPSSVYEQALKNQTLQYFRIPNGNIRQLKECLAEGYPFIFGFLVFPQFQSEQAFTDGIVKIPASLKARRRGIGNIGGHALLAIGWKKINDKDYFICQNSWGDNIGDGGFWYIPAGYLKNQVLAWDFWTIRLIETPQEVPQETPQEVPQETPQ